MAESHGGLLPGAPGIFTAEEPYRYPIDPSTSEKAAATIVCVAGASSLPLCTCAASLQSQGRMHVWVLTSHRPAQ